MQFEVHAVAFNQDVAVLHVPPVEIGKGHRGGKEGNQRQYAEARKEEEEIALREEDGLPAGGAEFPDQDGGRRDECGADQCKKAGHENLGPGRQGVRHVAAGGRPVFSDERWTCHGYPGKN